MIVIGFVLGVTMAAPPGPVMTVIMRKSLVDIKSGFLVGMGAMTADVILLLLLLLLKSYVNLKTYDPIIFILGGFYFIYLALDILLEFLHRERNNTTKIVSDYSYFKGLTTGLLNPMQIGWWLTAGLSIVESYGITPFYFFYIGIMVYIYFLSLIIYKSHAKYQDKVSLIVNAFSVTVLLAFGAYFILSFFIMEGIHF